MPHGGHQFALNIAVGLGLGGNESYPEVFASFGGGQDFGMGSALGVFLFFLVLPAMLFNIRRFRQEQQ